MSLTGETLRTKRPPQALQPFFDFAALLRANGFAVAPDQTETFVTSVGLLGPQSMADIYRAARASFGPVPERLDAFDALFRQIFLGQSLAAVSDEADGEDEVRAFDERDGAMEPPEPEEMTQSGGEATEAEVLALRQFDAREDERALRHLIRHGSSLLPRRRSRRFGRARHFEKPDMRRALRLAARRDGEVLTLPGLARRAKLRRIVLLIDVSGSMSQETEASMRFAHALVRAAQNVEVFTLGTRLTRITRAMGLKQSDQALAAASTLVADWDGGTRLGQALLSFLSVPRFSGLVRGSLTVILSDGLERGDPDELISAMDRLSRMAWSVLWLSPLVSADGDEPRTEAMQAIRPFVDRLGLGSGTAELCREVLAFDRRAA